MPATGTADSGVIPDNPWGSLALLPWSSPTTSCRDWNGSPIAHAGAHILDALEANRVGARRPDHRRVVAVSAPKHLSALAPAVRLTWTQQQERAGDEGQRNKDRPRRQANEDQYDSDDGDERANDPRATWPPRAAIAPSATRTAASTTRLDQ